MKTSHLFTMAEKIEFLKLRNLINSDYVRKQPTEEVINLSYDFISLDIRLLHLIAKEKQLFLIYQNNRSINNWTKFIEWNSMCKKCLTYTNDK
ncbi:hypothetical protein [Seonamhaeicola marinus]|uniref:Uncharacterized protein n=1 Tax=Seonamhaeicola marinus TaxID=1912246 RepID=A0A5D0I4D4_9FLAO|nr:hypothetical protein [Seonamhaeicola marinus]TYA78546.1 hypothetical protein FUA24_09325 [Seonamhaeicola marinus]